jgi:acetylornithine deacetylase/succinyl-diaminopimelate desuccinylase-like protein
MPTRDDAIARASQSFSSGRFLAEIARRVALPTESQKPGREAELHAYLAGDIVPSVETLGFTCKVVENSVSGRGSFLIATRQEGDELPTVLIYGHGDVVMGEPQDWRQGLDPWQLIQEGDRWYGRGTADNKGQHTINLVALEDVIAVREGRLGFNTKLLIEMGEEAGSPGLHQLARDHADDLRADLLIASDGPRLSAERPTVFLGSRGALNFTLSVKCRDSGHHSGNWGGLLANPGTILANAIASLVDQNGRIRLDALKPTPIPKSVRRALDDITVGGGPTDPAIDRDWGEPGLTPEERVFAWNTLEVLAFLTGNPAAPLNAIPPYAQATLQLRYVVGTDIQNVIPAIRAHLAANGLGMVEVAHARQEVFSATRLDPDDPWVDWALGSIAATTGKKPALLPNLGGSLPNDVFSEILGLPTIWVPHSYGACGQHAPDEHLLASLAHEALQIMAGLFFDLGDAGPDILAKRNRA